MSAPSPTPQTPQRAREPTHKFASGLTTPIATYCDAARAVESPALSPPSPQDHVSSSLADNSLTFSSGGSIIYHGSSPSEGLESSFEKLDLSNGSFSETPLKTRSADPASELKNSGSMVNAAPTTSSPSAQRAPTLPASPPADKIGAPALQGAPPGLLNPAAPTFESGAKPITGPSSSVREKVFHQVLDKGKNAIGELTEQAKAALAAFGLRTIPSLHGTPHLPYARNPSGLDAFRFSVDEGGDNGFIPIPADEIDAIARQRPVPLPLPGNARYTPAGRMAQQRNASAPAALSGGSSYSATQKQSSTHTRGKAGLSRREATANFSSVHSIGVSAAVAPAPQTHEQFQPAVQYDSAQQVALALQAQHLQLAQAHRSPFPPDSTNSPATVAFPHWTQYSGHGPIYQSPYPHLLPAAVQAAYASSGQPPYPITSSASIQPTVARRPSIIISPEGVIGFVDSATVLELATQQRFGDTSGVPSSRVTSFETAPELDSDDSLTFDASLNCDAGMGDDSDDAALFFPHPAAPPRPPTRAEQLDRRLRRLQHRPTRSDAFLTTQAYFEQGRRNSAMAAFPPPGGMRKSSLAQSGRGGPRHVSSAAHIQYTSAPKAQSQSAHSRRASIADAVNPALAAIAAAAASTAQAGPLSSSQQPSRSRRGSFQISVPSPARPTSSTTARQSKVKGMSQSRPFGDVINTVQSQHGKEGMPSVRLEPPTPQRPSTSTLNSSRVGGAALRPDLSTAAPSPGGSDSATTVTAQAAVNEDAASGKPTGEAGPTSRRKRRQAAAKRKAGDAFPKQQPVVGAGRSVSMPADMTEQS
ncbi:uncharacterized protein JCM10292_007265 [Rhodotorula paludigena]|uniref:uncharacterized protein n=1 Tax=Rhodotorula paludigena TaxID=86838 RepID=UPI00316C2200